MKTKLLPCPFCGTIPALPENASVITLGWVKEHGWLTAAIRCDGCGIFILGKKEKPTDKLAVKEAARVWNTRK